MVRPASHVPLDRLQEGLPGPLRAIPVQAVLAAVGLVAIGTAVLGLSAVRSDRAVTALEEELPGSSPLAPPGSAAPSAARSASPGPAAAQRSAAELSAAKVAGVDALAALAKRFPDDVVVLQALGTAQARERKDLSGALKSLRRLLEASPDTSLDREVQLAWVELANGPAEVAAEAFEVLQARMGSVGADLVFELAQGATGKYAKEHAAAALDDPGLKKSASPALLIADELRRRQPCQRKPSVAKAAVEGDARSLPYLRPLLASRPCGGITAFLRAECPTYTCFAPPDRVAVAGAIAAIEKRDPGAAKAPPAPTSSASAAPPPPRGGSMLR